MTHFITSRPLPLNDKAKTLIQFLNDHPEAHTAYIHPDYQEPLIEAVAQITDITALTAWTTHGQTYRIRWLTDSQPKPQYLPLPYNHAQSKYTQCQNAPIKLGCQIQPNRKPWVGTAGAPIKFRSPDHQIHYGFITNAHVSGTPVKPEDKLIHQPSDTKPPIATTTIVAYPSPSQTNQLDVAFADSKLTDYHTTAWEILDLGQPSDKLHPATPHEQYKKVGRTTGLTRAVCTATEAVSKINYGTFTATFTGLDVFQPLQTHFSQPGDSGSLILHNDTNEPSSLLFAGGGTITLGIPILTIKQAVPLSFNHRERL